MPAFEQHPGAACCVGIASFRAALLAGTADHPRPVSEFNRLTGCPENALVGAEYPVVAAVSSFCEETTLRLPGPVRDVVGDHGAKDRACLPSGL